MKKSLSKEKEGSELRCKNCVHYEVACGYMYCNLIGKRLLSTRRKCKYFSQSEDF